jgi:hypothetical protein
MHLRHTSAQIKASIEYASPFGFRGRLSHSERSTRVADLSLGTVHVDGSVVRVDRESTVSFEVSLTGPWCKEDLSDASGGTTECEPVVIKGVKGD